MAASLLTYRILNVDDFPAAFRLLEEHYAPNHPLLKYLGGGKEDVHAYFSLAEGFIKQGNSFGAYNENNELCALLVNTAPYHDDFSEFESNIKSDVVKAVSKLSAKLVGNDDLSEVSKIVGTDQYWELKMVAVDPRCKGINAMSVLQNKTVKLARMKGIKKLVSYSTYDYDEKLLKKMGPNFQIVRSIDLKEYVDPDTGTKIFVGMKPPYTTQVMIVYNVDGLNLSN